MCIAKVSFKSANFVLVLMTFIFIFLAGCNSEKPEKEVQKQKKQTKVKDYQIKLLNTAFKVSSSIPEYPHIKDRSRSQYDVIEACLALGLVDMAEDNIEDINNWRKGAGYAEIAYYYASMGDEQIARKHLLSAEMTANDKLKDWRSSRIKSKIAKVYTLLKNHEKSAALQTELENAEIGKIKTLEAKTAVEEDFNNLITKLDELLSRGDFDITNNVMNAYAELYNKFYIDEEKRKISEERITGSWKPVPIFIRIELLCKLADFSLQNDDPVKALKLSNQAWDILEGHLWPLQNKIELGALIASVRFKAGKEKLSRKDMDLLYNLYKNKGNEVIDIYRAEALCPLAEGYAKIGNLEKSLFIYNLAIEESMINPNSRPRAEDLSMILCSMALNCVKPDPEFWVRLDEVMQGLGDPW